MKKIGKTLCSIVLPLIWLISGAPARAAEHSGTKDEQAACTPDVFRLCFFEIPNEDRIVACLNRKVDNLSPACRDVIAGPQPQRKSKPKR